MAKTLPDVLDKMMESIKHPKMDFVNFTCDLASAKFSPVPLDEDHREDVIE